MRFYPMNRTTAPKKKSTTEWLPISSLSFDPTVNTRPTKKARVREIAKDFDPEKLRIIEVSERADGQIVILDGQHRVEALRSMGWNNGQMVECVVHRGISHARECALFDGLNNQLQMAAMPKMIARVGAGEEPDASIASIVESVGLRLDNTAGDGVVVSAKALYIVYGGGRQTRKVRTENPDLLRATLRLILSAWGNNKNGLRGDLIQGVGAFLARYGETADTAALVTRLAQLRGGPLSLVADGRALGALHNSPLSYGIAGKLTFIYNERRRAKRLPDWWA